MDFKVLNYPDTSVYVGYHFGSQKYLLDTLIVENDAFTLRTNAVNGVYFLYSPKFYFEFILENGRYSIQTDANTMYESLIISGSKENELFKEHDKKNKVLRTASTVQYSCEREQQNTQFQYSISESINK